MSQTILKLRLFLREQPHPGMAQCEAMKITYSEKLISYMQRKGHEHIVVEIAEASTCCSGFATLTAHFASSKEVASLSGKVVSRFEGSVGDVLVLSRGIEYDNAPELGLRSFLGIKDISFKGMRAFHL